MPASIDSLAFRRALGNFATGITVVTATAPDGARVGVTANSFNSVSLDPALILWSIDKRSASLGVFETASHFAVNVLSADQMALSNHFARPSDDKFTQVDCSDGLGGAAILPECAAVFECRRHELIEGGDHWIIVGEVERFNDAGRAPLLYHQGSYSLLMPMGSSGVEEADNGDAQTAREGLGDNLYYLMLQAVRRYEADYRPKQLATGLRTAEARMLLSLQAGGSLDREALSAQVNMPREDMRRAFEDLTARGFICDSGDQLSLEPCGLQQADTLLQIVREEQARKFADFKEEDIATFRRILHKLTNQ